jgi:hypothetical protein
MGRAFGPFDGQRCGWVASVVCHADGHVLESESERGGAEGPGLKPPIYMPLTAG